MYKDYRYINAGQNEIYRYGHKAVEKVQACLTPNDQGWLSIPVDGGKYWTIGTSEGKYGEFAKVKDTIFSVNSAGYMYAKVGSSKGEKFVEAIKFMIAEMNRMNQERLDVLKDGEEEEEE